MGTDYMSSIMQIFYLLPTHWQFSRSLHNLVRKVIYILPVAGCKIGIYKKCSIDVKILQYRCNHAMAFFETIIKTKCNQRFGNHCLGNNKFHSFFKTNKPD